ncbi:hypothetical protein EZV62_018051 [Acer yangbiense]|uniref:SWIM-type domain-containing protein n=1 Tax=Acer yangbiense TaxID=1000413 RepID=A0A5C7HIP4_9ROSI|nr:hypothetical protein EZV62_018051 [Acer yangbiense]
MGYLKGCKPFIGLDGCHLKGPYEGILLCAIAINANCGVYPNALGVCELKCRETWTWFLQLLYEHMGQHDNRTICFMSDRQKGLVAALHDCWPNHINRSCGRHILQNLLSTFKIDYLKDLFWPVAVSTNVAEFVEKMGDIKNASEIAHQYLMDIPLELWSVHAFDTLTKTDHNTNNIVEAFNGWLNKYQKLPMLTMLETIRRKLMKRIHERFETAMHWESNIPPIVNKKLQEAQKKGRYLDPLRCGEWEFEVVGENRQFVVKLNKRTCDCGIWDVSGLPCKHAMACITKKRDDVEEYVHHYLKKLAYLRTYLRTYANAIHALLEKILSRMFSIRLCSKCQQTGHNSRTCKEKEPAARQKKRYQVGSTSNAHSTNSIAKKNKTCQVASSSSFSATGRTQTTGHMTTGALNSSTAILRTTTAGHILPTRVLISAPPGRITRVLWFPSTQPTTSTQGFQPHQLSRSSQDVTPTAPYATWPSQGSGYKT